MPTWPAKTGDADSMTDNDLYDKMRELDDSQLADLIAAVDAAEIVANNKPVDMGAAAAWYARVLRWPVFPCRPGGKAPLTRNGFKDATVDLERIAEWWTTWPEANIGVPTGADGCGYDVVDVDGRDGNRAWAVLKHRSCPPDCSAEVFCPAPGPFDIRAHSYTPGTPDKGLGMHLFIAPTGDGNAARLGGVSIDYRGAGGYVIVPPSTGSVAGTRYVWHVRPTATSTEAA